MKLDCWVKEIIVDPLSKEPLTMDKMHGYLLSPYGRKYPLNDELYDLRLLNNETTKDQKVWKEGQREYQKYHANKKKKKYLTKKMHYLFVIL